MKVHRRFRIHIKNQNSDQQQIISKTNELIQKNRYRLNILEHKIILYALYKVPKDSDTIPPITIPLSEFLKVCNMGDENYTHLKSVIQTLDMKNFWIKDDKGCDSVVRWFSGIYTSPYRSEITLQFNQALTPYLLQLRKDFSVFSILPILYMKSIYSIKLYEDLKSYVKVGSLEITLDDFRKRMLGDDKESIYPIFADLRKRVIEPALKEINLYSDLKVEWYPIRKGRTYDKLQFIISTKSNIEQYFSEQEVTCLRQRTVEGIQTAGLQGKQIGQVLESKLLVEKEIPTLERNYGVIEQGQQHIVVKSNDLIRKTRCNLSAEEQKIILYALSKISKDDVDLHDMTFDVLEFSRLCGLEGQTYARIKDSLTKLQSKPFWIEMSNGVKTYVNWFSKVHMKHYSGKVTIKFHDDLAPYILQPKNEFTSFSIYPILAMESKYSIRLYELLKSYEAIGDWWFTVEDFQKKLDATNYQLFGNLKQKVIDVSVKEINLYSDLDVSWQPVKEGRKVTKIQFHISHKPR